jgi:ATP-binding cassette subfamily B protein
MRRANLSLLAPEVLQTSLTDCGPAALKAVLEGFGIRADYDQLRDRCETDVDGTSIDALAKLGGELGLRSQRVLVSRDSLLLPQANCLPAIVVTRSGGGLLHFIVVWSVCGPWVQIMDPGSGRRWLSRAAFLEMMPDIPLPISARRWRRWAGSENALGPLRERMRALGISRRSANALLDRAALDPSFRAFATLDAGVRMAAALVGSGALRKGAQALRLVTRVLPARSDAAAGDCVPGLVPPRFWWVSEDPASAGQLIVRGSVIVHFARAAAAEPRRARAQREAAASNLRPMRALFQIARRDSHRALPWALAGLCAGALLVPVEAIVLRGALSIEHYLALDYQRVLGVVAALTLMAVGLVVEQSSAAAVRRIGLGLETRLRVAFLERLPLLDDPYLRSRPSSDMAGRAHAMHLVHEIPVLWAQAARALLTLLATAGGLIWLHPQGAILTAIAVLASLVVPYLARRSLTETNLRLRTHGSALERFYFDALLGVSPIRVHGAERAVRCEHEALLTEWAGTAKSLHVQSTGLQALQLLTSTSVAAALVTAYVTSGGAVSGLLLFAFWALRVPSIAQELAVTQLALRTLRATALRLLAPLIVPLRAAADGAPAAEAPGASDARGIAVAFERVTVRAGGHELLRELDATIAAGDHVAIVGASGAGKSSLLGVLLGWHEACEGRVLLDGARLDATQLGRLREQTAWVDPAVRLWERSLYDNLVFGHDARPHELLPVAMERADLTEVLAQLPEGLQANLGEGGLRVSGGQGQRVRLGRAQMRDRARLVLLDEPFRGLERDKRQALLRNARKHWPQATLLFVSHDIKDALQFGRVLVMADGRIVEDGDPAALVKEPNSRYGALFRAEQALRDQLWRAAHWRHAAIERGALLEREAT